MNHSVALLPAMACLAWAMSASRAEKSFQPTGPEQAGRCWKGEAKYASIADSSGKSGSPVPSAGELGPSKPDRRSLTCVV